jgi:hypothetical protein
MVLTAFTVIVYAVPAVRPVMVHVVAEAPVPVHVFVTPSTCGDALAVKLATVTPLTAAPAAQVTTTCPTPAVAVTPVGALGVPPGVDLIEVLGGELPLVPTPLAVTVIVYSVPLASPVSWHVLVAPSGVTQENPPGEAITT